MADYITFLEGCDCSHLYTSITTNVGRSGLLEASERVIHVFELKGHGAIFCYAWEDSSERGIGTLLQFPPLRSHTEVFGELLERGCVKPTPAISNLSCTIGFDDLGLWMSRLVAQAAGVKVLGISGQNKSKSLILSCEGSVTQACFYLDEAGMENSVRNLFKLINIAPSIDYFIKPRLMRYLRYQIYSEPSAAVLLVKEILERVLKFDPAQELFVDFLAG